MQIYLSHAMSGVNPKEQNKNAKTLNKRFTNYVEDTDIKLNVFDPYIYYNYEEKMHLTEKEIFRFELENVRKSDLIIYEELGYKSIGASMELAIAHEHRIPIIILNEKGLELHPWIEHVSNRVFTDINELIDYVEWYYVI